MTRIQYLRHTVSAVALGCAAVAGIQAQPVEGGTAEETVVVTGERRVTNLQKTAISATVLSGKTLEKKGIVGLTGVQFAAPGVQIADYASANTFNIRGVGQAKVDVDLPSGVTIYRDGVPTLTGYFQNAPYYDMASVEVLRGPQGVNAGKSASAGAVFIRTRDPELGDEVSGSLMAGVGDFAFIETTGVINVPIGETFAVRLSFHGENRDSLFDSIETNPLPGGFGNGAGPYEGDDERRLRSVRLGMLWKPTDNFTATFKIDYDYLYFGSHATTGFAPGTDEIEDIRRPVVNGWHIYRDKGARASLKLSYELDNGITLNSLSGYQTVSTLANWDINGSDPAPFGFVSGGNFMNYSQEFNVLSPDEGRLTWVAGVFIQRYINSIPPLAFGFNTNNGDQVDFTTPWRKNETGYAVFANVAYDITEALQIEVGARWNHYEFTQFTNFAFDPTGLGGGPGSGLFPLADGFDGNGHKQKFEEDSTDWKVALNYQVNDDHFLYGLISRGHTPGSINLFYPPDLSEDHLSYDEMSVINYEAGWKGVLADGQLRTQLNVYYQVFKDYQADFGLEAPGVPASLTTTVLQNALTDSTIYGVEFGFQGRFGDFGIDGGLAYSKSELGNFGRVANEFRAFYGGPDFIDLDGARTPFAPEWTANIGAEYTFHMSGGDDGATLTPRLDIGYRGKSYSRLFQNKATELDAVTLLNGNIRYENGPWAIELWGTNLTDEKYAAAKQNVEAAGPSATIPVVHINGIVYGGPRRLFGLRVTHSF